MQQVETDGGQRNTALEFEALKNALVAAGTPIESIEILINASSVPTPTHIDDDSCCQTSESGRICISARKRRHSEVWTRSLESQTTKADEKRTTSPDQNLPKSTALEDTYKEEEPEVVVHPKDHSSSSYEARSLILSELPVTTSLSDVTKAIRGGLLLNVFLRSAHRTAHVAFVEPAAAWHFFEYVKQNGLNIKSKRVRFQFLGSGFLLTGLQVNVEWDQRQNYLSNRVARSVYHQGATRNLVIRFPSKEVTAEIIRDDLEHIHYLEVVSIIFKNGHFWISLNSISHALNARSCLATRKRYKGSRIEFWPDECAEPLPTVIKISKPNDSIRLKPTALVFDNRFGVFLSHTKDEDRDSGIEP